MNNIHEVTDIEISVIIATRNRESILWESVGKALTAIENQKAEVIIVNDGDRELSIPPHFSDKIKVLNNFKRGVSKARNIGAENAKGSILFFVDDDMWINTEIIKWIEKNLIDEKKEDAVYNVNWEYPPELVKKLRKEKVGRYILSSGYHTSWGRMHKKGECPKKGLLPADLVVSCSFVISKEIFIQIGGYNELITFQGEDKEITMKLKNKSIALFQLFGITLHHNHKDRIEIKEYLERLERGYRSEFKAEKNEIIPNTLKTVHKIYFLKSIGYYIFLKTEVLWILIFKLIPNNSFFNLITNKLIGTLSGLQKFKQWKANFNA